VCFVFFFFCFFWGGGGVEKAEGLGVPATNSTILHDACSLL